MFRCFVLYCKYIKRGLCSLLYGILSDSIYYYYFLYLKTVGLPLEYDFLIAGHIWTGMWFYNAGLNPTEHLLWGPLIGTHESSWLSFSFLILRYLDWVQHWIRLWFLWMLEKGWQMTCKGYNIKRLSQIFYVDEAV